MAQKIIVNVSLNLLLTFLFKLSRKSKTGKELVTSTH